MDFIDNKYTLVGWLAKTPPRRGLPLFGGPLLFGDGVGSPYSGGLSILFPYFYVDHVDYVGPFLSN